MIYSLDNFELLWETYEFHTKYISELESDHIKHMEEFNKSSNEKDSFNLIGDNTLCCNKLINGYVKNIDSIDDLIESISPKKENWILILFMTSEVLVKL
jgi:hypothetical protein